VFVEICAQRTDGRGAHFEDAPGSALQLDLKSENVMIGSMRVAIPVFPGVEELDAIAPLEVFGTARNAGLDVDVGLVTHSRNSSVTCCHGLQMGGLHGFSGDYDLIVVPGGAWLSGGATGVRLAVDEGVLPQLLRQQYEKGATITSVCTGTFLLLAAGLLEGIPATTHHSAMEDLRASGVQAVSARVVDAGRILTSGGIASGLDLSLWILERTFGKSEADRVAEILEYERRGGILHHP
jgi:transcriptional regulator GlxA family with amidase domain